MTPRKRNSENRNLPARWRYKHGAYYYRVPAHVRDQWDGKMEYLLGHTIHEAYRTFANRVDGSVEIRTMGQLFDRYAIEVIPTKAPKSQESNLLALRRLRPVFQDMPMTAVKPRHAYKFVDFVTRKHGPTTANRHFEVLCHAMSMGVSWGVLDQNVLKGQVTKNKLKPKQRYVEDREIAAALTIAHPTIRAYIPLKQIVGLRCSDMLRLRVTDLLEDGVYVDTGKTGAKLLITWTSELRAAVDLALSVRPTTDSEFIFCNRNGKSYATTNGKNSGFKSLWQRFMLKALAETDLKEKFSEHDIRKKTGSDMDSLESAQRLLGHTSSETTRKHYRLKAERVAPHSIGGDSKEQ